MSETELALHVGLNEMLKRAAKIQPTTATTGNGLDAGFDWYEICFLHPFIQIL